MQISVLCMCPMPFDCALQISCSAGLLVQVSYLYKQPNLVVYAQMQWQAQNAGIACADMFTYCTAYADVQTYTREILRFSLLQLYLSKSKCTTVSVSMLA